uniref:hypothetical protein n=1 Tax=Sphingomonas populi TaxID=2484750 RepID=UPI0013EEA962|nr:hypothetical protein [Sphingomonas populi]
MPYDIPAALKDPAKALAFAAHLADGYLTPAFGARTKSEIDLLGLVRIHREWMTAAAR